MNTRLVDALAKWNIGTAPAKQPLHSLMETFFPNWEYGEELLSAVPVKHSVVKLEGNEILYLWKEETIVENHLRCLSYEFLQVGSLLDGGTLAVDTREIGYIGIGSFSVENCGRSNWTDIRRIFFRKFPFSYQHYLMEIVGKPDLRYLSS